MRGPGMEFKEILDTVLKPWRPDRMKAWGAGLNRLGAAVKVPSVPVKSERLRGYAGQLGRLIWKFNLAVNRALIQYREPILDMLASRQRNSFCANNRRCTCRCASFCAPPATLRAGTRSSRVAYPARDRIFQGRSPGDDAGSLDGSSFSCESSCSCVAFFCRAPSSVLQGPS